MCISCHHKKAAQNFSNAQFGSENAICGTLCRGKRYSLTTVRRWRVISIVKHTMGDHWLLTPNEFYMRSASQAFLLYMCTYMCNFLFSISHKGKLALADYAKIHNIFRSAKKRSRWRQRDLYPPLHFKILNSSGTWDPIPLRPLGSQAVTFSWE